MRMSLDRVSIANLLCRAVLGVATLALLDGCVTTVFESPVGNQTTPCDAAWPGDWLIESAVRKFSPNDHLTLKVGANCKVWKAFENGKEQHDFERAKIVFTHVGSQQIVAVKFEPAATAASRKDRASTDWDSGFHYFSYVAAADEIRLREIDDSRVGRLIMDGTLAGRTERISRYPGAHNVSDAGGSLHNYVAGSPTEMLQALTANDLFAADAHIVLTRIHTAVPDGAPEHPTKP